MHSEYAVNLTPYTLTHYSLYTVYHHPTQHDSLFHHTHWCLCDTHTHEPQGTGAESGTLHHPDPF